MSQIPHEQDGGVSIPAGMSAKDVAATLRTVGYGDEEVKDDAEQFIEECNDWLANWFETYTAEELNAQKPFAFLFDPSRPTKAVLPEGEPRPSFRTASEIAIGGHIYAADLSLRRVFAQAAVFDSGPALLGHIHSEGWAGLTVIVVAPASRKALVHRGGADFDDGTSVSFRESGGEFSFEKTDAVLEDFYSNFVETHECDCDIWKFSGNRELKEFAERQVQRSLHGYIKHGVLSPRARIDQEIQTSKGRADVRVLRSKSDGTLECVVLELKVLRKTKTAAENLQWAKDGVDQVVNYAKTDKSIVLKYVCCYDGRKVDEAMPEGVKYAADNDVRWRRYFMTTQKCERLVAGFDS